MVAAGINPVAFTYVVGQWQVGFGINVAFKRMAVMAAVWAGSSAVPAVVGFKSETVVHGRD